MATTVYTEDTNAAFHAEVAKGGKVEVDEGLFDYYLDVLPPRFMGRTVTLADGSTRHVLFGFGEGGDPTIAFWKEGGRHFAQRTASKR